VNAVIGRDEGKCQHCGETDVELHAPHIKSYKDHH
jgi:5-methylcytosine-specific restriction endonuclease McrA